MVSKVICLIYVVEYDHTLKWKHALDHIQWKHAIGFLKYFWFDLQNVSIKQNNIRHNNTRYNLRYRTNFVLHDIW
jgi:hypothetical protein